MDSIGRSRRGDVDVLTVKGNIEHTDMPDFERELEASINGGNSQLVLNISDISHVCSSALGALISLKRRVRRMEGDIRIVATAAEVLRVFQITLLDRVFLIFDSVDAAVHSFQVRGKGHETP